MVYESRAGRDVPARRVAPGASRTSPTSGSSSRRRRASPARCRSGTATGPAARSSWAGRSARSSARSGPLPRDRGARAAAATRHGLDDRWPPPTCSPTSTSRPRPPASVPDDRTIVVERFRDEIGDWRVCVLSPFGAQVHAPWAMALQARLAERWGVDVELMWSDDGIVLRLPEAVDELPARRAADRPRRDRRASSSASSRAPRMFAVALPGVRGPGPAAAPAPARPAHAAVAAAPEGRRPAGGGGQVPDVPDPARGHPRVPQRRVRPAGAARGARRPARPRRSGWSPVDTPPASPFAQSLLFGWIAVYMYEGDAPLAERRAAALALDRDLLRDLLGAEELRELIDPAVLGRPRARAAAPGRRAPGPRRRRGRTTCCACSARSSLWELDARCETGADAGLVERWVDDAGRPSAGPSGWSIAGEERVARGRGRGPPARRARRRPARSGCRPRSPTRSPEPLADLVARFARTHGPFLTGQVAAPLRRSASTGSRPVLERARGRRAASCGASSGPTASSASGATTTCCASCGAARWPRCAARSSRSTPTRSARFLPALAGRRAAAAAGVDALVEAIGVAPGRGRSPASVLEADVLPARVGRLPPGRPRRAVHRRRGGVGRAPAPLGADRRPGPPALPRPGRRCWCPPRGRADRPTGRCTTRCATTSPTRGASFWPDLVAAAAGGRRCPTTTPTVLAALWDLVWAGRGHQRLARPAAGLRRRRRRKRGGRAGRPRPGARGPASARPPAPARPAGRRPAAGRWSPAAPPLPEPAPTPTEAAHARALQLLERYGVLTREAALGEGIEGGFAGVYPVLKALEERGQVRRGYFVAGLGAAQFACPARSTGCGRRPADERASLDDEPPAPLVLAATDPAQPYGAALPWPEQRRRPARAAGALVVLVDGDPVAYLERGGKSLATFPAAAEHPHWADGLAAGQGGRCRQLEIAKVDGGPARESPVGRRPPRRRLRRRLQGPRPAPLVDRQRSRRSSAARRTASRRRARAWSAWSGGSRTDRRRARSPRSRSADAAVSALGPELRPWSVHPLAFA